MEMAMFLREQNGYGCGGSIVDEMERFKTVRCPVCGAVIPEEDVDDTCPHCGSSME